MKYTRSFPLSAFLVERDEPNADVTELQVWLSEGKRSVIVPAVNKDVPGSIAQGVIQERIKSQDVSYYTSVPTSEQELLHERAAIGAKLSQEIELANCLGAKYFIFQRADNLADSDMMSFCHLIAKACSHDFAICRDQLVIRCDVATDWELWKCMSKALPTIRLCLALTSDYSWLDDNEFEKMMLKWSAEQITMILCDRSSVKLNQSNQPSMSKRNREVVLNLGILRNATIVLQVDKLEDRTGLTTKEDDVQFANSPGDSQRDDLPTGWCYARKMHMWLRYVHHKYCEVTPQESIRAVYSDMLQEPLQPLGTNLALQQYAVFEEDTIKYEMYKAAIKESLIPLLLAYVTSTEVPKISEPADESSADELDSRKDGYLHVAYLGGGRGLLLEKCFEVLKEAGWTPAGNNTISRNNESVELHFSLVEKNPAAILLLRANLSRSPNATWWKDVDLIEGDMREWRPEVPVSLAFSELLGSIGDNELAPECMQLKCVTENTLLIPRSTTSYFQPITSAKLFNSTRGKEEMGSVCHMVTYAPLSMALESAFTFNYADYVKRDNQLDPINYARLKWTVAAGQDNWCHGFAGYFHAQLSDNISLSTCPGSETFGLDSWYPLYLPIYEPIWCHASDNVQLDIWRCSDAQRVWYEWIASVKSPRHARITSRIHNLNGLVWAIAK